MKPEDYSEVCETLRALLEQWERRDPEPIDTRYWDEARTALTRVEAREGRELFDALLRASERTKVKALTGALQHARSKRKK